MFILDNYALAVTFCFVTMLCWGSWANTGKLADKGWRFELYYWDYVWGVLLLSVLSAFSMGSIGSAGRSFLDDIHQADYANIYSAVCGGALFNLANILLMAAIAIAGMSVAFPVGIGIALILGIIDNYIAQPLGNPVVLFAGVLLIALAIVLNAIAFGRLNRSDKRLSTKGLLTAIISGCLMGLFYGFVAKSMATNHSSPEPGMLTPYTAIVCFSVGLLLSNLILNTLLMKIPLEGQPLTFADYFKGSTKSHVMGLLGGMIWCLGMLCSIIASDKAGPAISYGLGQGATIVAAIWGIYIWKEFAKAPPGTLKILNWMLIIFVAGLTLLITARII
ncbi:MULTISPECIES: GRP family sugar transporter [Olivibacter]|uniref:GRP family sugar transporter n=1 Tax=Olivibacter jilunii TaxID=985016 RepID=A0ABW6B902_9SPHI|nr:GRP family sugar transporter [Pseudosphingobacterium sp.]